MRGEGILPTGRTNRMRGDGICPPDGPIGQGERVYTHRTDQSDEGRGYMRTPSCIASLRFSGRRSMRRMLSFGNLETSTAVSIAFTSSSCSMFAVKMSPSTIT
eukprot:1174444-Prorocentrum_minimum.AAC.1